MDFEQLKTTGLNVQYYCVCKRKLWLYNHQINFEQENDKVLQGYVLHEQSYNRTKNKEVLIDSLIKIDLFDEYVGEVKSSSKMKHADMMQLLYYLYFLKQMGIQRTGKIHYPKEKKVEEVELTELDEEMIHDVLVGIKEVIQLPKPPKLEKLKYCTKCAYYNFCWVGESE